MSFFEDLAPIATVVSGITAGVIVVTNDRRLRLGMLAVQYLCVTSLISLSVAFEISVIKLGAGWLACSILGVTIVQKGWYRPINGSRALPTGWLFRIIAVLLVSTSAIGVGRITLLDFPGIERLSIASTLLLVGLGILQIGLTERPIGVGMGLLTIISGFEILYSALEPSLAVMALLASIHMGIALAVGILEVDVQRIEDQEA